MSFFERLKFAAHSSSPDILWSRARMEQQTEATRDLVGALHDQIMVHKIDRYADAKTALSEDLRTYDAFFRVPGVNAVIEITSVRNPDRADASGLFFYIYKKDDHGWIDQVVGIQTAKLPSLIEEMDVSWLSCYTPMELQSLARLVREGIPLSKEEHQKFKQSGRMLH
jgi:hypothetical protein